MTAPVPGRYGKRPPKRAAALDFTPLFTGVLPAHPDRVDYLTQLSGWEMLGNDVAGDCVAVTWSNFRRLVTATLATEQYPSQDWVWQVYKTQNPNFDPNGTAGSNGPGSSADQGMDIQTLLEYLQKTGGPDGVKAVCFGKVSPLNADAVDAALAIFGGLWVGLNVTDANETQFSRNQPWDYVAGSRSVGGHSVLGGGYNPGVKFITWATETDLTSQFLDRQVDELWVVVWPEHVGTRAFLEGVDQQALGESFTALTGRDFPVQPAPGPVPPQPDPGPVPAPTDVDQQLAYTARSWLSRVLHTHAQTVALRGALTDWMDAHYPSNGGSGGRHSA